jgi:hypothetical protein
VKAENSENFSTSIFFARRTRKLPQVFLHNNRKQKTSPQGDYIMTLQLKKILLTAATGATLLVALFTSVPSSAQNVNSSKSQSASEIVPASPQEVEAFGRKAKCSPKVKVTSDPMPSPGQKHRSSGNFDLSKIRVGQTFKVNTRNGVSFSLKRDIRFRVDPTLATGMKDGYYKRVSNSPLYPVYIADPRGSGKKDFTVTFCGL